MNVKTIKIEEVDWSNYTMVVNHDIKDVYLFILPNDFIEKVIDQGFSVGQLEEDSSFDNDVAISLYDEMQEVLVEIDPSGYYDYASV